MLQVMVAMSFLFLLVYAIMTMLENSARQQKRHTVLINLLEMQAKINFILNDRDSWSRTIVDTVNQTDCLRDVNYAGGCSSSVYRIFRLRDAADNIVLGGLPSWDSPVYPSGGFTVDGLPCTGFSAVAGAGSDQCPFSYAIIWQPLVSSQDPAFRITARLLYNGSPSLDRSVIPIQFGKMNNNISGDLKALTSDLPTKKPVNTPGGVVIDPLKEVYDATVGKYDVVVWRMAKTNVLSFRIVSSGIGNCDTTTFTARNNLSADYDPFQLVTMVAGNTIRVKNVGTFDCDLVANGNGVKGFQVKLLNTASVTPLGAGASFANPGAQSPLEFNTGFTLNAEPTNLQITQRCELSGSGADFGAAGAVNLSLTCRVID